VIGATGVGYVPTSLDGFGAGISVIDDRGGSDFGIGTGRNRREVAIGAIAPVKSHQSIFPKFCSLLPYLLNSRQD
jgi:hypothetical protein